MEGTQSTAAARITSNYQRQTAPVTVIDGVTYVARPRALGLANDPVFVNLLLRHTPPESVRVMQNGPETLARFIAVPQNCGIVSVKTFYPLGGVSLSPLVSTLGWSESRSLELASALRLTKGWHVARFCALDPGEGELLLPALSHQGLIARQSFYPSYLIQDVRSYEEYLRARTRSFRASVKTATSRAVAAGFSFETSIGIDQWKAVYAKRSPAIQGYDYSITAGFHSFLQMILEAYRPQDRLIEVGLARDGQLAGAGLGIINGDVLHFYQTAHDPACHMFRPGALVFLKMIERALSRGLNTVAFVSDADYLKLFTRQAACLCELEVFSRRPVSRALSLYRRFKRSQPTH